MKLRLINFRKYTDASFDLGDTITKISGESGSGKTTVFEAIFWCLYGKLQNIGPRTKDTVITGKTSVSLNTTIHTVDGDKVVQIDRTSSKNITIHVDDKVLSGDMAQDFINTYFGGVDSFLMTSYLRAENMHKLLASTPAEKREYTALLFPDCAKYNEYKTRLVEIRKSDECSMSTLNNEIASATASAKALADIYPWLNDGYMDEVEPTHSESHYGETIIRCTKEKEVLVRNQNTYSYLQRQLQAIASPEEIISLQNEYDTTTARIIGAVVDTESKETKVQQLQDKLNTTNKMLTSYLTYIDNPIPGHTGSNEEKYTYTKSTIDTATVANATKDDMVREVSTLITNLEQRRDTYLQSIPSDIDDIKDTIVNATVSTVTNAQRMEDRRKEIISMDKERTSIMSDIQKMYPSTERDDVDGIKVHRSNLTARLAKAKVSHKSKEDRINEIKVQLDTLSLNKTKYIEYIGTHYPSGTYDAPMDMVSKIKSQMMDSIIDNKGKEAKVQYLQDRYNELSTARDKILATTGYPIIPIDECKRILTLFNDLLGMAPSLPTLELDISTITADYDKNSTLLLAYERSYDNIEYNRKLDDILTCPKCTTKLRYTSKLDVVQGDATPRQVEHKCTQGDIQKLRITVDKLEERKNTLRRYYNKYTDIIGAEESKYKNVKYSTTDIGIIHSQMTTYLQIQKDMDILTTQIDTLTKDKREYMSPDQCSVLESVCTTYSDLHKVNTEIASLHSTIASIESDTTEYLSKEQYDDIRTLTMRMDTYIKYTIAIQDHIKAIAEIESDHTLYITPDKYKELQGIIRQYDEYVKVCTELDKAKERLIAINADPTLYITHITYKVLNTYISTYDKYISTLGTVSTLSSDLDILLGDSREYITPATKHKLDIRLKELAASISNAQHTRTNLQSQLDELCSTFNPSTFTYSVETLDSTITDSNNAIQHIREYSNKLKVQRNHKQYTSHITNGNTKLTPIKQRITTSHKLESILTQAYQEYVGSKLKEIEYDICILGKIFFDESMNITLSPGKESSTGTLKPSFDVKIEYYGIQYDDVRSMSTGERKRISLILLIVLTKYLDGRFIMLDEALNSISMDSRGIIMNEIAKLNIPIYITSHDDIPGGYDMEIKL